MSTECLTGASVLADREVWPAGIGSPSPGASATMDQGPPDRWMEFEFPFGRQRILIAAKQIEPRWLYPILQSLREFSKLSAGWDSYGAKPVRIEAAVAVLRIAATRLGEETVPPTVVPTPDGGLQMEWHGRQQHLEIQVGPDGAASAYYENATTGETQELNPVSDWPRISAWIGEFDQGRHNNAP